MAKKPKIVMPEPPVEVPAEKPVRKGFKAGPPLTDAEKAFIKEHCIQPGWTDQKIGHALGRHAMTVSKYRTKTLKIAKTGSNKQKIAAREDADIETKIELAGTEKELYAALGEKFRKSARATKLKGRGLLTDADFDYFVERWCDYHVQLEDMTATEEDTLEKLIFLDLRMAGNQKALYQCQKVQEGLRNDLMKDGDNELDPEDDKQLMILQTIDAYNGQEIEINKQYTSLLKEHNETQRALNATREQREASKSVGADKFIDLVKKFALDETRALMGKEASLMHLSERKKTKELKKAHQFLDGSYDSPILDGEDFIGKPSIEGGDHGS